MLTQKEVRNRIASVKNIGKITRAMEMVAAARLRRAEERISRLRPYANAIRRMTQQAAEAAENMPRVPVLQEHGSQDKVGMLLVTADRGLAGAFNSNILRAGLREGREFRSDGREVLWYAVGRRGVSSLTFRGEEITHSYTGFTDRPAYANAREIAEDLMAAYVDERLDRVDIVYNGYISPLAQEVTHETLLPLSEARVFGDEAESAAEPAARGATPAGGQGAEDHHQALWLYEPEPEEILERLVPDFVELSVFRALLESTASEHGARMTAMRSASDNAKTLIGDLTLEANRARQAEITQEIMEVVAGAEALG